MALQFDETTPDHLLYDPDAIIEAVPLTFACWFNRDVTSGELTLVAVSHDSFNHFFQLLTLGTGSGSNVDMVQRAGAGSTEARATSATGYTIDTWHHAAGTIYTDTTEADRRQAFIDGVGGSIDTEVQAIPTSANLQQTSIAANNTGGQPFGGFIAEVGIWNVRLSDGAIAALAEGVSPILVRSDALVAYWPLIGRYSPEIDLIGGIDMTLTGSPANVAHPAMIYPRRPHIITAPAAAAPAGVEIFRRRVEGY